MYKIAKENLSALFQSIAENQELYLPVEVSGQVNYKAWTPDAKVSRVEWVSAAEGVKFSTTMNEFVEKIHSLGKNVRLEDIRCRN